MQISDILRYKHDHQVWTIAPNASVRDLLGALAEHHIGAMIVCGTDADDSAKDGAGDGAVVGIVSERDVVRRLHTDGDRVLDSTVEQIMTRDVVRSAPGDQVDAVASLMTERRIRHLPVLDGDRLVGVVSIGDVVSSRIRQLQKDRDQLEQYITG